MSGKPFGADSTRESAAQTPTQAKPVRAGQSQPAGVELSPSAPLPSPYRSPKLVRFGTLIELTQSGNGTVGESAVAKTRKPRPQS